MTVDTKKVWTEFTVSLNTMFAAARSRRNIKERIVTILSEIDGLRILYGALVQTIPVKERRTIMKRVKGRYNHLVIPNLHRRLTRAGISSPTGINPDTLLIVYKELTGKTPVVKREDS